MQFKIFDVLTNLIPGIVVISALFFSLLMLTDPPANFEKEISLLKEFTGIVTSIFFVMSYLVGYLIHSAGSWIEPLLWFTWRGRPSERLLKGTAKRIHLIERDQIFEYLKGQAPLIKLNEKSITDLVKEDYKSVFQTAKNLANHNSKEGIKERISEFNSNYIFSRNILVAFLIVILLVLVLASKQIVPSWIIGIFLVILLLFWQRCKERALYYSREIFIGVYYSAKGSSGR